MTTRRSLLFALLGLLVSLPLSAQRTRTPSRPTSRPSVSRPAPVRQAPRATPRPAPRPAVRSTPRPAPRVTPRATSRPAPRPAVRAPSSTPPRATRPSSSYRAPARASAPSRATTPSRTTYRAPAATAPRTATGQKPRAPSGLSRSYTPRTSSSVGRYRPGSATATAPSAKRDVSSARSTARPVRTPTTNAARPTSRPSAARYSSARTAPTRAPSASTARSPRRSADLGASKPDATTAKPLSRTTRLDADIRAARGRKTQPPVRQRYQPRDVAKAPARRPGANAPVTGSLRPRGPAPTSGAVARATATLAPRLGSPRPAAPAVGARTSRSFVGYSPYRRSYGLGRVWSCGWGWNNSWCGNTWGWGLGAGWGYSPFGYGWATRWSLCGWGGAGFSPWAWNVGVLAPYYAWHSTYWNNCYQSTYWNNWSVPNALPASYWWYPTTTYCPTYLYVPSSVAVVSDEALAPAAGGSVEVLAAGSDVVGSARAGDGELSDTLRAGAAPRSEAMVLAEKYVELGDFYFQASRFDDAAEAYAKARNFLPDDASVHFVLADAVFANGDYHYAAFLIAEAVRLQPDIVTAETDKRAFYGDPAAFEAQLESLQRYCKDKPYDAWAQLLLGYNLRFSDRPTRALASFRKVLELDPTNPTAAAFLAALEEPAAPAAGEAASGR